MMMMLGSGQLAVGIRPLDFNNYENIFVHMPDYWGGGGGGVKRGVQE